MKTNGALISSDEELQEAMEALRGTAVYQRLEKFVHQEYGYADPLSTHLAVLNGIACDLIVWLEVKAAIEICHIPTHDHIRDHLETTVEFLAERSFKLAVANGVEGPSQEHKQ